MTYLGFAALLFATWALILFAAAQRNLVVARRSNRPTGGVSIFPGLPVMPLGFLLAAWLLEQLTPNLGLLLVGGLHLGLALVCLVSIAIPAFSRR